MGALSAAALLAGERYDRGTNQVLLEAFSSEYWGASSPKNRRKFVFFSMCVATYT